MALAGPAGAHPHVWVTGKVILAEGGQAIDLEWRFDKDFSDTLLQRFKKSRGPGFSEAEQIAVRRGAFVSLKDYNYFVNARWDEGEPVRFGQESGFRAWVQGDAVVYRFTLPLPTPPRPGAVLNLAVFDPEYFVSFEPEPRDPIASRDPARDCRGVEGKPIDAGWGPFIPPTFSCAAR